MNPAAQHISQARALLLRATPGLEERAQAELSVELAHTLLAASHALATRDEKANAERLASLMDDDKGQAFATAITDRVHRSKSGSTLVRQVRALIAEFGIPQSLDRLDRLELRALMSFGSSLPELTAAAVKRRIYRDASPYIVPADSEVLDRYLRDMAGQNTRVNVNHLGEEVLGEREAARHLAAYLDLLERDEVSTISVKISSLYSQLRPLAFEHCVALLSQRLAEIYRKALAAKPQKLVYLDMESYRDLAMTVRVFMQVLDQVEFSELTAGIVLQAYLPDSVTYQKRLTEWAKQRVASGKAPIRVRVVKGANLAMERLEASHRGWPLATYHSKREVDANYKRLLLFACQPENARAVRLGVASHNVFDLSLALVVRRCQGVESSVELEMLEGMAQSLRRAVQAVAGSVLVYAPSVDAKNFPAAVAYLVRRLDENTGEDNFLRHSFGMQPGDAQFQEQATFFLDAFEQRNNASVTSYRATGRRELALAAPRESFHNEPDTDFTNEDNRVWVLQGLERIQAKSFEIRLEGQGDFRDGVDPSRPGIVAYRYEVAGREFVEQVLATAVSAASDWGNTPVAQRVELLLKAANALRAARGELIGLMVLDAGKRVEEADAEVSEVVDFAEYYARQFSRLADMFETRPKGVVLVTPPWNFPLAIPGGGVLAALAAGNAVILKPAPETVLVASRLVRLCHEAGIPETALQLLVVEDDMASDLIRDERVNTVVLTGGTQTAHLFHRLRPGIDLIAETGGKNAIYVSDVSDHEQACRHIVHSAFSHAGQKCSACSLLILHKDIYYDESFKSQLVDAAQSLPVGSAWLPESFVTPLIREPEGALLRAMKQAVTGEEWLLTARQSADNPRLVSPGIKYHVRRGSGLHLTELFGPILSVMSANGLAQALELVHQTPYGLTSGIQSLDPVECRRFAGGVDAGNVYVNQPITGAIVGRQPFGGRRSSGFGPGAKAGGPNYVAQFCTIQARRQRVQAPALSRGPRRIELASSDWLTAPEPAIAEVEALEAALPETERPVFAARARNYRQVFELEFSREHPQDDVLGVRNVLRYQPTRVVLLLLPKASAVDAFSCLLAARMVGAELTLLMSPELNNRLGFERLKPWSDPYSSPRLVRELVQKRAIERLRSVGRVPGELWELPSLLPVYVAAGPAHDDGYVELRRYLKEQAVSTSYHRYGNLSQPQGILRPSSSPPQR